MSEETEASRVIPDLEDAELVDKANAYFWKRRVTNPRSVRFIGLYIDEHKIYRVGDGEKLGYLFLVNPISDRVVYFVRFNRVGFAGLRLGRQVLVVRDPRIDIPGGFPQHVFFDILLPNYTALIADKQQTRFGRKFWLNALQRAIGSSELHAYFLDRRTRQTQLIELQTPEDLTKYGSLLWGTAKQHELTFGVISNKPLRLKNSQS